MKKLFEVEGNKLITQRETSVTYDTSLITEDIIWQDGDGVWWVTPKQRDGYIIEDHVLYPQPEEHLNEKEMIFWLVGQTPRNLSAISYLLKNNDFSKKELMEIAVKAAERYEISDQCDEYYQMMNQDIGDDYIDASGWYIKAYKEYDPVFMKEIESHPLIKILKMLLDKGMDPNIRLEGEDVNIMWQLHWVDMPFLGAAAMRLLIEQGADIYIKDNNGECLFNEIDGCIAIDIDLLPYEFVQGWFQCWILMIGYGGRTKDAVTFYLMPGHSYDELKEFEYYDWRIQYDSCKRKNILHIIDIRTGEEIGYL